MTMNTALVEQAKEAATFYADVPSPGFDAIAALRQYQETATEEEWFATLAALDAPTAHKLLHWTLALLDAAQSVE